MTEHKYTDEEVIRVLECCSNLYCVDYCPFKRIDHCESKMSIAALDLIKRQKAEIEELKEKNFENEKPLNDRVVEAVNAVSEAHRKYERALEGQIKTIETAKAEAIKEFVERLCEGRVSNDPVVISARYLLKEI